MPSNRSARPDTESGGNRLDTDTLMMTVKIATACRAELESLCIIHGISYRGQPAATLREALRQRLATAL
ncbi:MAG: hypothetical protein AB8C46_08200 [Burkholderiaceae bacterium]